MSKTARSNRILEQETTCSLPLDAASERRRRRQEILRYIAELPDDAVLSVEEVAVWLSVEPAWVRAHANGSRRPKIPSRKMGKFRIFIKGDVAQFLRDLKS